MIRQQIHHTLEGNHRRHHDRPFEVQENEQLEVSRAADRGVASLNEVAAKLPSCFHRQHSGNIAGGSP